MLRKQPNGQLLVAVDRNQLWMMAPETVDSIDWPLPPPSCAVPPKRLVQSINLCSQCRESTLQPSAYEATTSPMRSLRAYSLKYGVHPAEFIINVMVLIREVRLLSITVRTYKYLHLHVYLLFYVQNVGFAVSASNLVVRNNFVRKELPNCL